VAVAQAEESPTPGRRRSTGPCSYAITALKRMMGAYGTREQELDDLLRRGVFVDLLRVVRNGIRTSRPGLGLKELEAFLDFERRAEVRSRGRGASVVQPNQIDWPPEPV
jgi:hypothetical protein